MIPGGAAIFVALGPVDMRRSFDGLAAVVRDVLRADGRSGALFLFTNRARDRLKLLWWDRNGYCLLYKRLERGVFRLPEAMAPGASHVTIEATELALLLEGIELPASRLQRGAAPLPRVA